MNRTIAPEFKEVEHIELIQATSRVLDNGIKLFCIDAGEQELVRIEFIFENIGWDQSKPLQAYAVNSMLMDGTSMLHASEISSKIDYYGAFVQLEYSSDQSLVVLYTLNKHLSSVLPVIQSILTDSIFPLKELDTFKQIQKQKYKVSLEKNDVLSRRAFNSALFGNSRYGYAYNLSDYDNLTRDELIGYFSMAYDPANCTIVASGKIKEETLGLLNEYIGSIPSKSLTFSDNAVSFEKGKGDFHYVERADALQSAIRIGQLSINRAHPDFPALQVLNTILGGYFGSRLMTNIREDKGYTYGIGSALTSLRQAGSFFIASEVGAEVCAATITEVEKEINLLKTEFVREEELSRVKSYMLGSFLGSLENAFSHADKFKNIHFFGLGYEYYTRYLETVKSVTPEQLISLAGKYLDFEGFEKVVVGPTSPIIK